MQILNLINLFGIENVEKICMEKGGKRIYIPKKSENACAANEYMSQDMKDYYSQHFCGEYVYIPTYKKFKQISLYYEIIKKYKSGMRVSSISRVFKIKRDTVYSALQKLGVRAAHQYQLELFE